ncbi:MAG: hypothetical protein CMP22_06710 [Rickettsiales bacterium]|nr:hypothetical protein [Rickettsiales bacterium]|tara:strand:+ start:597 stop:851 length:255 start_codon:yes stop_codon:yes gene_type:complete
MASAVETKKSFSKSLKSFWFGLTKPVNMYRYGSLKSEIHKIDLSIQKIDNDPVKVAHLTIKKDKFEQRKATVAARIQKAISPKI